MGDGTGETERDGRVDEVGEVDPREAERMRRRDRDLDAEQRALLRPGMGKVFKQILDHQEKAAASDLVRGKGAGRGRKRPR